LAASQRAWILRGSEHIGGMGRGIGKGADEFHLSPAIGIFVTGDLGIAAANAGPNKFVNLVWVQPGKTVSDGVGRKHVNAVVRAAGPVNRGVEDVIGGRPGGGGGHGAGLFGGWTVSDAQR